MTRTPTRRQYLTTGIAAGITALAGCGGPGNGDGQEGSEAEGINESEEEDPQQGTDENETPEDDTVENVDHENPDGSVSFVSPEDGEQVSSPVQVEMEVEGFEVRAVNEAEAPEDGYGHLHVIVDEGCIDPGYVIPQEDGYHHLSEGELETELDLEAGEHELCAQIGDAQHNAYDLSDEITIEVTEGGDGSDGSDGNESSDEGDENGTNVDDEQ